MEDNNNKRKIQDDRSDLSTLSEVLHRHEEESITDEQVQRMLDPVLQMIYDGKFT